ncbi:hypothetical protein DFH06DRAFT_1134695 [Mycena polygramma]|nr:hypothetical protein DFH06DRAFT_1134695 [Mycena polygramma]
MDCLLPRPSPTSCDLEESREALMLSANRDPMIPNLFWAINHPQIPKPNRCLVYEIDLSPENMRKIYKWESTQQVPNLLDDEELQEAGWYELPAFTPLFSRGEGSVNAWDDACQGWFTAVIDWDAVDTAIGDPKLVTLKPPVRDTNGNWTGGLAMERGDDRCKPVKEGTRCYTIANSYPSPRELWSPIAQSKVNGAIDEGNLIRKNLISNLESSVSGMAGCARDHPPACINAQHPPPLGVPENFGYQTMQVNVAPAVEFGSNFSYAGVVQPPTAMEVGEIIRGINKGGVRGLELLRLVGERPRGNGRAFKMGNADEIRAAFCRLHGFLNNKL